MAFNKLISYLFHPLLFSFIGTFFYLFLSPKHINKKQEYIILFVVFISTYILPIVLLLILKKLKLINSFKLESIQERKFPLIFFIVLSIMVGKMLLNIPLVNLLAFSFFGIALALAFTYILFYFNLKSSLHLIGIGGIIGLIVIISFEYQQNFNILIASLFILAGIIAVSRLKLKAHKPLEIYIGFLLGFITQFMSYQLYQMSMY